MGSFMIGLSLKPNQRTQVKLVRIPKENYVITGHPSFWSSKFEDPNRFWGDKV